MQFGTGTWAAGAAGTPVTLHSVLHFSRPEAALTLMGKLVLKIIGIQSQH